MAGVGCKRCKGTGIIKADHVDETGRTRHVRLDCPDCPTEEATPLRWLSWCECHNFDLLDPCTNAACPLRGPCVAVQCTIPLIGACSELVGDCPNSPSYPEGMACAGCRHFKVCGALDNIEDTEASKQPSARGMPAIRSSNPRQLPRRAGMN